MMSCMTGKAAEAGPSCESSCLPVREGSSHHHHQLRNCHYHHHRHPSTSQHLGPVTLYNSCKVLEPRTTAMWPSEAPCCWQKPCFRVGCSTTGCRLPTTATATVSSAFHKTFHPTHPSNMSFHIQKLPGKRQKPCCYLVALLLTAGCPLLTLLQSPQLFTPPTQYAFSYSFISLLKNISEFDMLSSQNKVWTLLPPLQSL